jgi:DNA-binding NarL/FixJ family response regulator
VTRTPVFVHGSDQVLRDGIIAQLRARAGVTVVDDAADPGVQVAIVASDDVDDDALRVVRVLKRNGCSRVILIATRLDESGLIAGVEAGVSTFLRRADVSPDGLSAAVLSAATGDGSVPPDLLGRLLEHMARLHNEILSPHGLHLAGLSDREVAVLRLVADGLGTAEIAANLCYSERTVKGVIHEVTTRLRVRSRAQAVAYAVRQGLI